MTHHHSKKKKEIVGRAFKGVSTNLTYLGLGECHLLDKVVFVKDFYPGEEGKVEVEYKRNGQYFGKVRDLTKRSPYRIKSHCHHFKKCGGCVFQDYFYEEELKFKQEIVKSQLKKLAHLDVNVLPTIEMEKHTQYRNKIQVHFGLDGDGKVIAGFYKEGTHKVIRVHDCRIQDKRARPVIESMVRIANVLGLSVYDETKKEGLLRHLLIRTSYSEDSLMVVLVTSEFEFAGKEKMLSLFKEENQNVKTFIQSVNSKDTNVILGDEEHVLFGQGFIEDNLCGLTFKISPRSFYQTNHVMTEKLYAKAMELAAVQGNEVVLDAYSGIGTIGIIAAKKARKVISVELEHSSVLDAMENARRNGVSNIEFHEGDATEFILSLGKKTKIHTVFMDPPRKGSTIEFLNAVKELKPRRVVYISCNPSSLAVDLRELVDLYKIKKVQPVDLFPRTIHVETIVGLYLKDNKK